MTNDNANIPDSEENEEARAEEIAALEAEYRDLEGQKLRCEQEVRRLRSSEDHKAGIFYAREIFTAQHEKLRLEVEMEFRRKRANRLRLGYEELMFR